MVRWFGRPRHPKMEKRPSASEDEECKGRGGTHLQHPSATVISGRGTVLVTRNFTKSDEIRGNSARNPQSFCAAIRGMILCYPRNDTSLSAE